jgi:uncharacterized heparinase superfamily protein
VHQRSGANRSFGRSIPLNGAAFKDFLRLAGLFVERFGRSLRRLVTAPARLITRWTFRPSEQLLIAPQDIRTSDPTRAADISAGYFAFGGKIVNSFGHSPFTIDHGSPDWARALAGFSWLRHLRAADDASAHDTAHMLVNEFLINAAKPSPTPAWEPLVIARRTLSWLSQSPLILESADRDFYARFMRALGRAQILLEDALRGGGLTGEARVFVAIALAELNLCAVTRTSPQRRSTKYLGDELDRQILEDGGHISRNPQVLIDLLLDLLPLRQAYAARNIPPPPQLSTAIERMMPALRLFRHGDGALALFNGMGVTAPETLATVLAYDDARIHTLTAAPFSGYQRLEVEGTLVIVDTGTPPPKEFSQQAHAGCLSFEFSVGLQRLITNCGAPGANREAAREAARTTPAHSTLTLDDTSSCRFAFHAGFAKWLGDQILSGPKNVSIARRADTQGTTLHLSHDGYEDRFGVIHGRNLTLSHDGRKLRGQDLLRPSAAWERFDDLGYTLRFHIHPSVTLMVSMEPPGILFELPDGQNWIFEAPGSNISIAESVFFAAPDGPRRCEQIVISATTRKKPEVRWSLSALSPIPNQG